MIRNAVPADLPAILEIENESFDTPWSIRSFEAELGKDYSSFLVLEDADGLAGYIVVWHLFDEAEIANIAVHPSRRGRGYGALILEHVFKTLQGVSVYFLEVRCDNKPAVGLYEKYGFRVYGVSKGYYGPGVDAYLMRREESSAHMV